MIMAERKKDAVTVRFHDDFVDKDIQNPISQLNLIVSQAYRRRAMLQSTYRDNPKAPLP